MNLNRVFLIGRLTRDPEVKYTASNTAVCNFSIAVNHRYKDKSGEWREDASFIDCTVWGKTAETIGKHFVKGRPIFVDGRLDQQSWQNKDGEKRTKIIVVVDSFQFVDSRNGGNEKPVEKDQHEPNAPVSDEDIPF